MSHVKQIFSAAEQNTLVFVEKTTRAHVKTGMSDGTMNVCQVTYYNNINVHNSFI